MRIELLLATLAAAAMVLVGWVVGQERAPDRSSRADVTVEEHTSQAAGAGRREREQDPDRLSEATSERAAVPEAADRVSDDADASDDADERAAADNDEAEDDGDADRRDDRDRAEGRRRQRSRAAHPRGERREGGEGGEGEDRRRGEGEGRRGGKGERQQVGERDDRREDRFGDTPGAGAGGPRRRGADDDGAKHPGTPSSPPAKGEKEDGEDDDADVGDELGAAVGGSGAAGGSDGGNVDAPEPETEPDE